MDVPSVTAGVRVAAGDVTGDGAADIITSFGPGAPPIVRVFNGSGLQSRAILAYNNAFTGGVFVAAGDVNGDGYADVITGAGPGGGPHVRVWSGATNGELAGFFAYAPAFAGGVRVAAGDVNGDGRADIITGAGPGGGPHVRVFDGGSSAEIGGFFAYPATFSGGVHVASQVSLNRMSVDVPAAGGTVPSAHLQIAGWALIEGAPATTTGVEQVHAWAYRVAGGPPFFLNHSPVGFARPDVASLFGGQFAATGFQMSANLSPGTYDIVVFVFDVRTGRVTNLRVVRTTVN